MLEREPFFAQESTIVKYVSPTRQIGDRRAAPELTRNRDVQLVVEFAPGLRFVFGPGHAASALSAFAFDDSPGYPRQLIQETSNLWVVALVLKSKQSLA